VIGYGAPNKRGGEAIHGAPLGSTEVAAARANLGWPHPPFEIPSDILGAWRSVGARSRAVRLAWEQPADARKQGARFRAAVAGDIPEDFPAKMTAYKAELVTKAPTVATRKASEMALDVINATVETTLGGSADLTHSNLTITKGMSSLNAEDFSGRYVRYVVVRQVGACSQDRLREVLPAQGAQRREGTFYESMALNMLGIEKLKAVPPDQAVAGS
jgi:transketolase